MPLRYARLFIDNVITTKDGYALHRLSKFVSTPGLEYTLAGTDVGEIKYYICSGIGTNTDADIVIADAVDGVLVTEIGDTAFIGKDIVSVYIPDSVTKIGYRAFETCTSLLGVEIPHSVINISTQAFLGCKSLESVIIHEGVQTIGQRAFTACGVRSIEIPHSMTQIGIGAFHQCSSLESVTLNTGVQIIDNTAFFACPIQMITIPSSVTTIGDQAFSYCDSLNSVILEEGVQKIGKGAFSYCTALSSIEIPVSVTSIGDEVFTKAGLNSITYAGTAEQWNAIEKKVESGEVWKLSSERNIRVYCADGTELIIMSQ